MNDQPLPRLSIKILAFCLCLLSVSCLPAFDPPTDEETVSGQGSVAPVNGDFLAELTRSPLPTPPISSQIEAEQAGPAAEPTTAVPSATPTITPTPPPTATATPPPPLLAYLRHSDVWLYHPATAVEQRLTTTGDIRAFAWSPNGAEIAALRQQQICRYNLENAKPILPCALLPLPDNLFAADHTPPTLRWSPNGRSWLLEQAEWWLVDIDTTAVTHIANPTNWGVTWPPDYEGQAMTGDALFTPDNTILGAVTHPYQCGSGGCSYKLAQFDPLSRRLLPTNHEGGTSLSLTTNERVLISRATGHVGCGIYSTTMTASAFDSSARWQYVYDQETFFDVAPAPDTAVAILSPGEGCSSAGQNVWSVTCGLSDSFEIYPMQWWAWESNSRTDLVPGLQPTWSPNGDQIAFRSCLTADANGRWQPVSGGPPWLYTLTFHNGPDDYTIKAVAQGQQPAWQPRP